MKENLPLSPEQRLGFLRDRMASLSARIESLSGQLEAVSAELRELYEFSRQMEIPQAPDVPGLHEVSEPQALGDADVASDVSDISDISDIVDAVDAVAAPVVADEEREEVHEEVHEEEGMFMDPFLDDVPERTAAEDGPAVEEPAAAEPAVEERPAVRRANVMINDVSPVQKSIMDGYAREQAWRTDRTGAPVSDVRSAITLNDRVLFINKLFNADPQLFQNVLLQINTLADVDAVLDLVRESGLEWDMASDTVYRFMMAVRRKIG